MNLEAKALKVFKDNLGRKGFSYTDVVTVAVMKEFKMEYLLSYDLRSFQGLMDNIVGPNYWQTLPVLKRADIKAN